MNRPSIDDRVSVKMPDDRDQKFCIWDVGSCGTVRCFSPEGALMIGVEFDEPHKDGHDLNGLCPYGYGYFVFPEELECVDAVNIVELTDISTDNLKLLFGGDDE